jgi:hypothetical protein
LKSFSYVSDSARLEFRSAAKLQWINGKLDLETIFRVALLKAPPPVKAPAPNPPPITTPHAPVVNLVDEQVRLTRGPPVRQYASRNDGYSFRSNFKQGSDGYKAATVWYAVCFLLKANSRLATVPCIAG